MDVMDLNAGFLVCVRCMTYNQSAYITDALNGFCMQKTAFPYYVVVFDDASTDGEQKVIKTYLDENFNCSEAHGYKQWEREEAFYVFAQHLENTNCHFLVVYLKKNLYKTARKDDLINEWCKAKYIALCEGDDYWTDPLKLQKQVDFMEINKSIGLCYTDFDVYQEKENKLLKAMFRNGAHRSKSFEDHLLTRGYIAPLTWLLRRDVYDLIRLQKFYTDGSFAIALEFYHHSNVAYLDEVTAIYRVHENSASRQSDAEKNWRYYIGVMDTQLEYARKYGDDNLVEKVYFNNYIFDTFALAVELNKTDFIKEAREYLVSKGFNFDNYLYYLKQCDKHSKLYKQIYTSHAYRFGHIVMSPLKWIKKIL